MMVSMISEELKRSRGKVEARGVICFWKAANGVERLRRERCWRWREKGEGASDGGTLAEEA
jgi:hypothetical protein